MCNESSLNIYAETARSSGIPLGVCRRHGCRRPHQRMRVGIKILTGYTSWVYYLVRDANSKFGVLMFTYVNIMERNSILHDMGNVGATFFYFTFYK
jgi:hypothetical protein